MRDILVKLEQLGFSSYEAKAYYTLLRKHPANGYEISKIGKIPAAKVYDTLNRLKIKGVIVESSTDAGHYYPVPPEKFITKVKDDFASIISDLEVQLLETGPIPDIDLTMNISGYDALIDKLIAVIRDCQSSLLLSVWPEEAILIADTVKAAKHRGIVIVGAVFGECELTCNYSINLEWCGSSARKRLGKRLTAIVSDNKEVVIGEMDDEAGHAEGIWTTTPGIVLVTKEYIKHDIWGNVMVRTLGEKQFQTICEQSPLLTYLIKNR